LLSPGVNEPTAASLLWESNCPGEVRHVGFETEAPKKSVMGMKTVVVIY
jgi:hypothetical protein